MKKSTWNFSWQVWIMLVGIVGGGGGGIGFIVWVSALQKTLDYSAWISLWSYPKSRYHGDLRAMA